MCVSLHKMDVNPHKMDVNPHKIVVSRLEIVVRRLKIVVRRLKIIVSRLKTLVRKLKKGVTRHKDVTSRRFGSEDPLKSAAGGYKLNSFPFSQEYTGSLLKDISFMFQGGRGF